MTCSRPEVEKEDRGKTVSGKSLDRPLQAERGRKEQKHMEKLETSLTITGCYLHCHLGWI